MIPSLRNTRAHRARSLRSCPCTGDFGPRLERWCYEESDHGAYSNLIKCGYFTLAKLKKINWIHTFDQWTFLAILVCFVRTLDF